MLEFLEETLNIIIMHNAFRILAVTSLIAAIFFVQSTTQAAVTKKKNDKTFILKSNVKYLPDPSR